MKYLSIITFLVCVTVCSIQAQTIQYSYDNAGNRIQRKVFVSIVSPEAEATASARNSPFPEATTEQVAIQNSIKVFPNPAQNQLQITLGEELQNATIELFDLPGKLMIKSPLRGLNHSIDLTQQSSGEYILVVRNREFLGQWKVVKIE